MAAKLGILQYITITNTAKANVLGTPPRICDRDGGPDCHYWALVIGLGEHTHTHTHKHTLTYTHTHTQVLDLEHTGLTAFPLDKLN